MSQNKQLQTFFLTKELDISLYSISEKKVIDIVLRKKNITQKVTSDIKQLRLKDEEEFNNRKVIISSNILFKSEDYNVGKHTVYGIEPGSISTDDCITCDGHGEITCNICLGIGDEQCYKCNGKTQIQKQRIVKDSIKTICATCSGIGTINQQCNLCKGKGNIFYLDICTTCKGLGRIQKGYNPQLKRPIFDVCPACFGKRKVSKQKPCNSCNSTGTRTGICYKCSGRKEIIQYKDRKETYFTPCNICNQTGKITCRNCRGNQTLICSTCKGERRTIQYQYNKFEIEVENNYRLINNKLEKEPTNIIALDQGKELTYLYEGEKEKLQKKSLEYNIKINKKNIRRVEGILYSFKLKQENKMNLTYYVFINKKDQFFYDSLPSKYKSIEKMNFLFVKISKIYLKVKEKAIKIFNKLSNKKTY